MPKYKGGGFASGGFVCHHGKRIGFCGSCLRSRSSLDEAQKRLISAQAEVIHAQDAELRAKRDGRNDGIGGYGGDWRNPYKRFSEDLLTRARDAFARNTTGPGMFKGPPTSREEMTELRQNVENMRFRNTPLFALMMLQIHCGRREKFMGPAQQAVIWIALRAKLIEAFADCDSGYVTTERGRAYVKALYKTALPIPDGDTWRQPCP